MRIHKKLQLARGYSLAVVIPKLWLAQHGSPREVELQMGRTRILVTPVPTMPGKTQDRGVSDAEEGD